MDNIIADYALMSVAAYRNDRYTKNQVFPSTDWQALEGDLGHRSYPSGFEAVAYRNTTSGEIVIAYTGTDELWDWWTNLGGVSGAVVTDQMLEAAKFYAEVFRANPNTSITFTGHSMGGGLAGLMAVLFNRAAYTFDPAPYRNSANNDTRETIRNYLQSAGLLDTHLAAALDSFHSSLPASRTGASSEPGIRGENMVWRMLVQNEAVSRWAPGEFIGTRTPAILGHASPDQSSIDLHSMSLLAAIAGSPGLFGNAVKAMPNLIPLIFDESLFNTNPSQASPTLLDHLLRNQVGVTGPTSSETTPLDKREMLDHFAADLGKIIQGGGDFMSDNNLNRGLIAFLGRAYLKQDQGYEKELFRLTGGGLNFDTSDITASISGDMGYSDYLKNYLAGKLGAELFGQYEEKITQLLDWYLAGTHLNATAGTQTAFMLGAGNTDSLTGGTQADLLVGLGGKDFLAGGGGADTLAGGEGADYLMGGGGNDEYIVTNGDTLIDATDDGFGGDGQGQIKWGTLNPAGSYDRKQDSVTEWGGTEWTFEFVGERETGGLLTIVRGGERITVAGFKSGMFGIVLNAPPEEAPLPPNTATPSNTTTEYNTANHPYLNLRDATRMEITVSGADAEAWGNGKLVGDNNANYLHDGDLDGDDELIGNGGPDGLVAGLGNDRLDGGAGDDALAGGAGDDRLDGGDNTDFLAGGAGIDVLLGGNGDDVLLGGSSWYARYSDWSFSGSQASGFDLWQFVGFRDVEGDGADYLDGGVGNDVLEGGQGNDQLLGGVGSDSMMGGDGNDMIDGGADNDMLYGDGWRTNFSEYYWLAEYHGDDFLQGGGGDDHLWGDGGSDVLYGGDDNDELIGDNTDLPEQYHGRDVLYGESGNDKLWGDGNDDLLDGGSGEDILQGGEGNDTLIGGTDFDQLRGDAGNDLLIGGAGYDALNGGMGNDTYILAAGDGALGAGNLVETIEDESGDDTVVIGAGLTDLWLQTNDQTLVLQYGPSDYLAIKNAGVPVEHYVIGGESLTLSELIGRYQSEEITWTDPQNNLYVMGGSEADTLSAVSAGGNTIVSGGQGNDAIYSYGSNIQFNFSAGDGQDAISYNTATDKFNTLLFGAGILPDNLTVTRYGNDLVLLVNNSDDAMMVSGFFAGDLANAYSPVQEIKFADNTAWDFATVLSRVTTGISSPYHLVGTSGDDSFTIDNPLDSIIETVGGGVDTVDSWISYGLGDNLENLNLMGSSNLYGQGNGLSNVIRGNSGNNELFSGNGGNDTLIGGAGNDTYYFEQGSTVTIVEQANQGIDTAWIRGSYAMPDNLEIIKTVSQTYYMMVLTGNASDNIIDASRGANAHIDGGAGADVMIGSNGADIFYVDNSGDKVYGGVGDTIFSTASYAMTESDRSELNFVMNGSDLDGVGNSWNNTINGNDGKNILSGGAGDDILDPGGGDDILIGGLGNDTYWIGDWYGQDVIDNVASDGVSAIDTVEIESPAVILLRDGNDLLISPGPEATVTVKNHFAADGSGRIDQIRFRSTGGIWNASQIEQNLTILPQGSVNADTLTGTWANDTLHGLEGDDTLSGNDGADRLFGDAGSDTLYGQNGNDMLDGGDGDDILFGGSGNDTLTGNAGNDVLFGESGNDVYLFCRNDGVDVVSDYDAAAGSMDIVRFDSSITEADIAVTRYGQSLVLSVIGTSSRIELDGWFDSDSAYDIERIEFSSGTVWQRSDLLSRLTISTPTEGDDILFGLDSDDDLHGLGGNDFLTGGKGVDLLQGDAGDDWYEFNLGDGQDVIDNAASDNATAVDTLFLGEGISATSITLTAAGEDLIIRISATDGVTIRNYLSAQTDQKIDRIEFSDGTVWDQATIESKIGAGNDVLTGTAGNDIMHGFAGNDTLSGGDGDDSLYGDAGNDTLNGNAGNDLLNGGTGSDKMYGGTGNDTYVVDISTDTVTENANEGIDLVQSSVTYTLGNNVENLTLTGTAAINGTGNNLDNILIGNSAANTLKGGIGNDTYYVSTGDAVTESTSQGTDTVISDITFTLGSNVENLTLTGTSAINGTGNTLNNVLIGNSASNILNGGTGNDTMLGNAGDDTYVVNATGDVVTENANEGTDLIQSGATYTLGNNVENLTLTGTTAINGTGNALDNILIGNSANNTLTGNAGNDTLDGGAGNDTMRGGTGDDIYVVNATGDVVTENANEGTDTVRSSITLTLGSNVENLTLTGTSVINGTGNTLNNVLTGNSANNTLTGNTGNDTLDGGAGTDSLVGGAGNDTYMLGRGYGADSVTENDSMAGNTDLARFLAGVATDQIWFRHVGNDLEASIIGTTDKLTISNWYSGTAYHVEQFMTADNHILLDTQVENLVQAMAAFSPPAAGQTTLPPAYQTVLAPVIAANWQ